MKKEKQKKLKKNNMRQYNMNVLCTHTVTITTGGGECIYREEEAFKRERRENSKERERDFIPNKLNLYNSITFAV